MIALQHPDNRCTFSVNYCIRYFINLTSMTYPPPPTKLEFMLSYFCQGENSSAVFPKPRASYPSSDSCTILHRHLNAIVASQTTCYIVIPMRSPKGNNLPAWMENFSIPVDDKCCDTVIISPSNSAGNTTGIEALNNQAPSFFAFLKTEECTQYRKPPSFIWTDDPKPSPSGVHAMTFLTVRVLKPT